VQSTQAATPATELRRTVFSHPSLSALRVLDAARLELARSNIHQRYTAANTKAQRKFNLSNQQWLLELFALNNDVTVQNCSLVTIRTQIRREETQLMAISEDNLTREAARRKRRCLWMLEVLLEEEAEAEGKLGPARERLDVCVKRGEANLEAYNQEMEEAEAEMEAAMKDLDMECWEAEYYVDVE
jgi:hypothetical protein